ncbi:hypothetical protein [Thermomonas carbonis]|uniref:Uncharacterized protein n=1 Tax=Thermomonas carbonis TaxID=1463158 RepID=A0A7G9SNG6_9GAMM|nr:hypothetical protein [Thermomonas carbonis]QNN69391.1 hypothetical protein H9L16_12000 [Thermomonas carbonis]QNN69412.1 hypothetical protein H9L16_12105 [Thermomonas carbonis]
MDEELQQLVKACVDAFPRNGLTDGAVDAFCLKHGAVPEDFPELLAKHVAVEFSYGEIGYGAAACTMDCLAVYVGIEFSGLPFEIYQAFDSGAYRRENMPAAVIPWQQYTLPAVMEILERERLLPRA